MFDKLKKRFSRNITPPSAVASHGTTANHKIITRSQAQAQAQPQLKPAIAPANKNAVNSFISAVLDDPAEVERRFEEMVKGRSVTDHAEKEMRGLDRNTKKELVRLWIQQDLKRSENDKENVEPTTRKRGFSDASVELPKLQKDTTKRQKMTARLNRERTTNTSSEAVVFAEPERPRSKGEKVKDFFTGRRSRSNSIEDTNSRRNSTDTPLTSPRTSQESARSGTNALPETLVKEVKYLKDVVTQREKYNPKDTDKLDIDKKLWNLRVFLRSETIERVLQFIQSGGLSLLSDSVLAILDVEWREPHETRFLLLILQCIRIILKTRESANRFFDMDLHNALFPRLLRMQFSWSEERRAFFKFEHRQVITEILYAWVRNVDTAKSTIGDRAEKMLEYLRDFSEQEKDVHEFIARMQRTRRYKNWHRELKDTTLPWKGTPWMYWHKDNVIKPRPVSLADPYKPYSEEHAPTRRPELICSSVRTHTETLVSQYVAANIDLLNLIIAALPDKTRRNALRQELKDTGFESLFGQTLRKASQTNFSCIAEALEDWVTAARADKWPTATVTNVPDEVDDRAAWRCLDPRDSSPPPNLTFAHVDGAIF